MSFFRNSVSLCCTSGWLTIVTPSMLLIPDVEYRAVADNFHWWRSVSAAVAGQQSTRGPGSTLENFRQGQRGGIELELVPRAIGEAVEHRLRQGAPFHGQRWRHLVLLLR